MLNNLDTAPSASVNQWIVSILTFHFELRHVPGKQHSPDSLSRRLPQPGDLDDDADPDDFDDWMDNLYSFIHLVNPTTPARSLTSLILTLALQITSPTTINTSPDSEDSFSIGYPTSCSEAA